MNGINLSQTRLVSTGGRVGWGIPKDKSNEEVPRIFFGLKFSVLVFYGLTLLSFFPLFFGRQLFKVFLGKQASSCGIMRAIPERKADISK